MPRPSSQPPRPTPTRRPSPTSSSRPRWPLYSMANIRHKSTASASTLASYRPRYYGHSLRTSLPCMYQKCSDKSTQEFWRMSILDGSTEMRTSVTWTASRRTPNGVGQQVSPHPNHPPTPALPRRPDDGTLTGMTTSNDDLNGNNGLQQHQPPKLRQVKLTGRQVSPPKLYAPQQ